MSFDKTLADSEVDLGIYAPALLGKTMMSDLMMFNDIHDYYIFFLPATRVKILSFKSVKHVINLVWPIYDHTNGIYIDPPKAGRGHATLTRGRNAGGY